MKPEKVLRDKIDRLTALVAADETYRRERVEAYRRQAYASAEKRTEEFAVGLAGKRDGRSRSMKVEIERLTAALSALGMSADVAERVEA